MLHKQNVGVCVCVCYTVYNGYNGFCRVLKVDALRAGKIGKRKNLSSVDKGQIMKQVL